MKAFRFSRETFLLFGILALALAVRLWGIGFGLPSLYHADEQLVVHHALAFGSGDLNPHYFKIPPLVSYVLFFLYGIYFLVMRVGGCIHNVADFQMLFLNDPTSFYLIGRIVLGGLLGTATVYFMYKLVQKFFSEKQALLTALFLALNFLHVQNSHYIYLDMPLLLVLVLCFFPILNILKRDNVGDYGLFGALAGLAVATKYNGSFIIVPFLMAHILGRGMTWRLILNEKLVVVALAALVSYSLGNPYTWLDAKTFFEGFFAMRQFLWTTGLTHHFTYSLREAMGSPLLLLSVFGIFSSLIRGERAKFPFLVFILGYYLLLTRFSQPFDRYVLPLVPFLLFFAADAILKIGERMRLLPWTLMIVALVALSPSVFKIVLSNRILVSEDVRTVAEKWIEAHIPPGAKLALGEPFFLPRLRPTLEQLKEKKVLAAGQRAAGMKLRRIDYMIAEAERGSAARYTLYFMVTKSSHEFLFSNPSIPYNLGSLLQQGVEYVLFPKTAPAGSSGFYDDLKKNALLVQKFSPYRDPDREVPIDPNALTGTPSMWREIVARERNGQIIEIYKLLR